MRKMFGLGELDTAMRGTLINNILGCRIDSSARSFGMTFISKELLTVVIYEHGRESDVMMRILRRSFRPLQPLHYDCCFCPFHVNPLRLTAIGDTYLLSSMCLSNRRSNNWRS